MFQIETRGKRNSCLRLVSKHVLKEVMNGEHLFYELELRWVRLVLASRRSDLAACAAAATRREQELRALLAQNEGVAAAASFAPRSPAPDNLAALTPSAAI
jgi:hypothetical protein